MAEKITSRNIRLRIWTARNPADVYAALTTPTGLESWLVPKVESATDNRANYRFCYPHHAYEVTTLETRPGSSVTYSWFAGNGTGPTVRFDIEPLNEGSLVRVSHDGFDPAEQYLSNFFDHIEGWTMYLCNLKCYLDFDRDLRSDQPAGTIAM